MGLRTVPYMWTLPVGTTAQRTVRKREYRRHLLRRSFRDSQGCPQKETLANLSLLFNEAITVLRAVLTGTVLVEVDSAFEVESSLSHGDVTAVHAMASQLGVKGIFSRAEWRFSTPNDHRPTTTPVEPAKRARHPLNDPELDDSTDHWPKHHVEQT